MYAAGLVLNGGLGGETSSETFPADANCSIPQFPKRGDRLSFSSSFDSIIREKIPHPLCCGQSPGGLRWEKHGEKLHLLGKWGRGLVALRRLEVT